MVDVGIIGAGPAGLSAAICAARRGLSVGLMDAEGGGGRLFSIARAADCPGAEGFSPRTLAERLLGEARDLGVVPKRCLVKEITRQGDGFVAVTDEEYVPARSLILANGLAPRPLRVSGERSLLGRGVAYYAAEGDRLLGGRRVVVIGDGAECLRDALYLSGTAAVVHIVCSKASFSESAAVLAELRRSPSVVWHFRRSVRAVGGEDRTQALLLFDMDTGKRTVLSVDEVFISLGSEPRNGPFQHLLSLDESGYAVTSEDCATSVEGLFAAGDTRRKSLRRIATAVADGATAAEGAWRYLRRASR